MSFIAVTDENIDLLKDFILKMQDATKTFRYFNNRTVDVIKNHLVTLIMINESKLPVAYGHLDKENENIWLGICVLPDYKGEGYGNKMMQELIKKAYEFSVPKILLTVDKGNAVAIKMYEKFQFKLIEETTTHYKYKRD